MSPLAGLVINLICFGINGSCYLSTRKYPERFPAWYKYFSLGITIFCGIGFLSDVALVLATI